MTVAETREKTTIPTLKARDFITKTFFLLTYPVKDLENVLRTFSRLNTLSIVDRSTRHLSRHFNVLQGLFCGKDRVTLREPRTQPGSGQQRRVLS